MKLIIVIDSELSFWSELTKTDLQLDYQVEVFDSVAKSKKTLESKKPILVVIHTALPDANAVETTWRLRQNQNAPEVIIITDTADADDAEQAVRSGAWEYLVRPKDAKGFLPVIRRFVELSGARMEARSQREHFGKVFERIAGTSAKIEACLSLASQAANGDTNVLIRGETGTGKELLAWAIHKNSPRSENSFVVVDCAALPETLVESTLFGHERGAFTGADKVQDGLVKHADGGTLFLDEVGELPMAIQKSFLRVLEERQFRRVGGKEEIQSNFRLLSASNKDLDQMVREGKFREDLLFRLRSFMIEVPPLRDRKEDIKSIVDLHLPRLVNQLGDPPKKIAPEYFEQLSEYSWPGNVRELVNALDRSVVAARNEPIILPQHLPTYLRIYLVRQRVRPGEPASQRTLDDANTLPTLQAFRTTAMADAETRYLRCLMKSAEGNISEACRISGLSRSRLYSLLKKHKIPS